MCKKSLLMLIAFMLALSSGLVAQVTISGFIRDGRTGEALSGASVYSTDTKTGAITNTYGFYSIKQGKGSIVLNFSFVGYDKITELVSVNSDTIININLAANNLIGEINVSRKHSQISLNGSEIGTIRIKAAEVSRLPAVLGESDVLKSIQLLPGVSAGSTGSAGFSVRGYSPDQTLVLLDEVPVYNVNHMFGYFSVFNTDAISHVELMKGPVPVQFGGRVGSVLNVLMREGNNQYQEGSISVSTMALKYTIEGPIAKGKSSYILSARKTLFDLPFRLIYYLAENDQQLLYSFYDINAKVNLKLSQNDRIYASFYTGRDRYFMRSEDSFNKGNNLFYQYYWGNYTATSRWNHIFSNELFSNLIIYYSHYSYHNNLEYSENAEKKEINALSSLNDLSIKYDFDFFPWNNHVVKFGVKASYLVFSPELTIPDSALTKQSLLRIPSLITDAYLSDEISFGEHFNLYCGLRTSLLVSDSLIRPAVLPSLSLTYRLSTGITVKVGSSKTIQHIQQLSNPSLNLPTSMWIVSNRKLNSATGYQASIGLYIQPNNKSEYSCETYINQTHNVIDYLPGTATSKLTSENWDKNVIQGMGRSYGIEFFAKHNLNNISFQISYSYSRAMRMYNEIANRKYFPYTYDRPHNLALAYVYRFNKGQGKKFAKSLSMSFQFMSGNMMSLANYSTDVVLPYEIRSNLGLDPEVKFVPYPNNIRLKPQHHLDVSYHLDHEGTQQSSWIFSIYNVYNQMNASFYYVEDEKVRSATLFPIIPSVTWQYKF